MATQKELFDTFMQQSRTNLQKQVNKGVIINSKNESVYIVPVLDKLKMKTWEEIDKEATLIFEGESELPAKSRSVVDFVHTHILVLYEQQFK